MWLNKLKMEAARPHSVSVCGYSSVHVLGHVSRVFRCAFTSVGGHQTLEAAALPARWL